MKTLNNIRTIQVGMANTYLIQADEGYVLVDTGYPNKGHVFFRCLKKAAIDPEEIRLIVITHGHYDHLGNLFEIKKRCNCHVLMHESDAPLSAEGKLVLPPGTGFFYRHLCNFGNRHLKLFSYFYGFKAVQPDIIAAEQLDLHDYGVEAKVVHTPGHTPGSISLIMDNGNAFIGDLAFNFYPFGAGPIFPPFAGDETEVLKSWEKIENLGGVTLFPGHGPSFHVDKLRSVADKRPGAG